MSAAEMPDAAYVGKDEWGNFDAPRGRRDDLRRQALRCGVALQERIPWVDADTIDGEPKRISAYEKPMEHHR